MKPIKCLDTGEYFDNYRDYIYSQHWADFRGQYFQTHERRCSKCGTTDGPIQLHHTTYDRLGREIDKDVEVLCRNCHRALHDEQKQAAPKAKAKKKQPRKLAQRTNRSARARSKKIGDIKSIAYSMKDGWSRAKYDKLVTLVDRLAKSLPDPQ